MKANPVANAGNAHTPANERIVVNAAMIKTILSGITPAIRNRIMYSPCPVLYNHTFLKHLKAVPKPLPKKGKDHQSCNHSKGEQQPGEIGGLGIRHERDGDQGEKNRPEE